jgi:hypothetical protein
LNTTEFWVRLRTKLEKLINYTRIGYSCFYNCAAAEVFAPVEDKEETQGSTEHSHSRIQEGQEIEEQRSIRRSAVIDPSSRNFQVHLRRFVTEIKTGIGVVFIR